MVSFELQITFFNSTQFEPSIFVFLSPIDIGKAVSELGGGGKRCALKVADTEQFQWRRSYQEKLKVPLYQTLQ